MQEQMGAKSRNMKLFVKRVFISDQFDEDLMPRYLSFMKGVIDSSDLPLNVSREILQENRVVRVIKKQLVKRTLDTLKQMSKKDDQTDYNTFFDAFGRNLKLVTPSFSPPSSFSRLPSRWAFLSTSIGRCSMLDAHNCIRTLCSRELLRTRTTRTLLLPSSASTPPSLTRTRSASTSETAPPPPDSLIFLFVWSSLPQDV